MSFIKPTHTVLHYARSAAAEEDDWGRPAPKFNPPKNMLVYGWAPPGAETEIRELGTGVRRDLDLYAAEPFTAPGDKVSINGVMFEAVGWPEDYTHGPFAFAPGCRINLNRVEG